MKSPSQFTREELYDLVWSVAIRKAAQQFGISDVALRKHCLKRGVPVPPRGYWAKSEAGFKVTKPALPEKWSIPVEKRRIKKGADNVTKLPYPDFDYSLEKVLPVVKLTMKALHTGKPDYYGLKVSIGEDVLGTRVTVAQIDRALWLWTKLIELLSSRGIKLVPGSKLTDGNQRIAIELKEKVTKYEMTKEEADLANKGRLFDLSSHSPQYAWLANGTLEIRADSDRYSTGRRWRESPRNRMEDRLVTIAENIVAYLQIKEEEAIQRAIQAEKDRIERQKQEEIAKARRHAAGRKRRLLRISESYAEYQKLYNLLQGLKDAGAAEKSPEFYHWVEEIVQSADPIVDILKDIEKETDPAEPNQDDLYPQGEMRWTRFD